MALYDSNKAPVEQKPDVDEGPADKPSLGPMVSNQERGTGDGARTVPVDQTGSTSIGYTSTQRQLSNQVKFAPNGKGTNTLKDPLNSYASKVFPAVSNPSVQQNDNEGTQYAKTAPGRKTNGPPSL